MPHPNKARKSRSAKRRQAPVEFDDSPEGIVRRIDSEIEAEEQEREAKRRTSGQRWAPIVESLFWLSILAIAFIVCAAIKLRQGLFGLSALAMTLSFVSAYGIYRARAVSDRFPVRWFRRFPLINGVSVSVALGLACLGVVVYAVRTEYL
ncbi:MAG TPA: hypothetical protein VFC19_39730 [Candidatus Limnocylindrales bacterium]|nr:hypothetical protein [Candidatus Limnocylindrales bacterium]